VRSAAEQRSAAALEQHLSQPATERLAVAGRAGQLGPDHRLRGLLKLAPHVSSFTPASAYIFKASPQPRPAGVGGRLFRPGGVLCPADGRGRMGASR
jgi:hypothetical protein